MELINSFKAEDYLNMMTAVAKNNYKYFDKYSYELDEIINELYIEVVKSLKKLQEKPKENHYNIDGWVMRSMYNKIKQLLNKETYRIKKNYYVEIVRPDEAEEFTIRLAENAIEHTRTMLNDLENDILTCLITPPQSLIKKETKTYSVDCLASYIGISRKKLEIILDKIRTLVCNQLIDDDYCYA